MRLGAMGPKMYQREPNFDEKASRRHLAMSRARRKWPARHNAPTVRAVNPRNKGPPGAPPAITQPCARAFSPPGRATCTRMDPMRTTARSPIQNGTPPESDGHKTKSYLPQSRTIVATMPSGVSCAMTSAHAPSSMKMPMSACRTATCPSAC